MIQIWRGSEPTCIFEQDIFGFYDRSGNQTKMVYTATDEIVRLGQPGDWYKVFGSVAPGGPHKLNVKSFEMKIIAEMDPERDQKIIMNMQANQIASLLLLKKTGLVTVDNVRVGLECRLR